ITLIFFSSRRRHTRSKRDWSSDVCSSDLKNTAPSVSSISRVLRTNPRASLNESDLSESSLKDHSIDGILGGKCTATMAARTDKEIGRASCRERVLMTGGVVESRRQI